MKTTRLLFLLAILAFASQSKAQIVLEHTYPGPKWDFFIAKMSTGFKYVKAYTHINPDSGFADTNYVDIYNADHTLYKRVNLIFDSSQYSLATYKVSDQLFDTDTDIELLVTGRYPKKGIGKQWMAVLDENSVVQHRFDTGYMGGPYSAGGDYIVKTSAGVKMYLSDNKGNVQVHSLPGSLPLMIKPVAGDINIAEAYPNPSSGKTVIPYALPEGVRDGEVVLYSLNGSEVKRYRVTSYNNTLELNEDLANGTYFYQLQSGTETLGAKKLVVIK